MGTEAAMKTVKGNLLTLAQNGTFDVIVHGCNCQCTMGSGIAKEIKRIFPGAFEADQLTKKGDRSKLGKISVATAKHAEHEVTIVNGYTQFHWRGTGVKADYDAIGSVMAIVKSQFSGKQIGYPKIGAGLANGDWARIAKIIDNELAGEDHTLVLYSK